MTAGLVRPGVVNRTQRITAGRKGGRPKGSKNFDKALANVGLSHEEYNAACRSHGPRALEVIAEIMNNADAPPQIRLAAAGTLLDRGYGRPHQAVELTGPRGGPILLETMGVVERQQMLLGVRASLEAVEADEAAAKAASEPENTNKIKRFAVKGTD